MENIVKNIDANFEDHIENLRESIQITNLISDAVEVERITDLIQEWIRDLGGTSEIYDIGELPLVYGNLDTGADKTLIIYRNYDIVEQETMNWKRDPFSGARIKIDGEMAIMGRGACAPKGPLVGVFNVLKEIKKSGKDFPVNIKIILEGDEQLGSPTLPHFVESKKEELQTAEAALFPSFNQSRGNSVTVPLGVKGVVLLELICKGGVWGGPARFPLHSSNASWVNSPVWRLVNALSTMKSRSEDILIEDFYESVDVKQTSSPLNLTQRQAEQVEYMKNNHINEFKYDLDDEKLFEKYVFSPTLNISSLFCPGSSRITNLLLPQEARARMDVRLVPHMEPDEVIAKIKRHLIQEGYGNLELIERVKYPYWRGSLEDEPVKKMIEVYRSFKVKPEVLPFSGTSLPFYVFERKIDVPLVVGGLGRGGRSYHTNEYVHIEGLKNFEKSVLKFLYTFA